MQPYSLLTGPLKQSTRWPQWRWFWPAPADQSTPDAPIVPQYTFRRGKFYKPLNRWSLFPTPDEAAIGDQPPRIQYTFRPGGFWQTQKPLLYPTPADQSIPDQPLVPQYAFRKGGFWQITRFSLFPQLTDPVIVPLVGGELGHVLSDTGWNRALRFPPPSPERNRNRAALAALFVGGELSEAEFIALLAADLLIDS